MQCVIVKNHNLSKTRTRSAGKYDWLNSYACSVNNVMIDKTCCNPDVLSWMSTMIMGTLKKNQL